MAARVSRGANRLNEIGGSMFFRAITVACCIAMAAAVSSCSRDTDGAAALQLAQQNAETLDTISARLDRLEQGGAKSGNVPGQSGDAALEDLRRRIDAMQSRSVDDAEQLKREILNAVDERLTTDNRRTGAASTAAPTPAPSTETPANGGGKGDAPEEIGEALREVGKGLQEAARKGRNEKMGIDESTATRLTEIETDYQKKVSDVWARRRKNELTREQATQEMDEARKATDAQVSTLLTPDQKKIYDEHGGVDPMRHMFHGLGGRSRRGGGR